MVVDDVILLHNQEIVLGNSSELFWMQQWRFCLESIVLNFEILIAEIGVVPAIDSVNLEAGKFLQLSKKNWKKKWL